MSQRRLRTAFVTGASRGLGKALARALARRGLGVVMTARDERSLERAAAEIRGEGGVAHALRFDVTDKEAVHGVALAAAALVGPIDVLVHNASSLGPIPMPLLLDTECEDLAAVLETNLVGPFRLTRAIAGGMVLRGRGVVAFVSSDAAVEAYPGWGAYGVSKAAADHLARSFAAELDGSGVRFLSVDPGEMDTDMHRAALPDADPASLARPDDVAVLLADQLLEPTTKSERAILDAKPRAEAS
jgi:NAD(P)-dependent dehydrogenase (short-subunit alcohol dehydrogenase family)